MGVFWGFIRLYGVPLKPPPASTGLARPRLVRALALPGVPRPPAASGRLPSFLPRPCTCPPAGRGVLSPCRRAVRGTAWPDGAGRGPSGGWVSSRVAGELCAGPGPPGQSWWDRTPPLRAHVLLLLCTSGGRPRRRRTRARPRSAESARICFLRHKEKEENAGKALGPQPGR